MAFRTAIKKIGRKLLDADERAYRTVVPFQEALPIRVLSAVGAAGDQGPLRLTAAGIGLSGLLSGDQRLLRAAIRMAIAHELATALKSVVKHRVDRSRPEHADDRHDRKIRKGEHTGTALSSFPSGHSAGAIAVARAFTRELPEHRVPALGSALTIAAAQVPRCSHYVTDVAAGLAVGAVAEAVVNAVWNSVLWKSRVEYARTDTRRR